jgi:predicted transposase YdaD
MQGGNEAGALAQALQLLRSDPNLAEMETLLAFFARFVFPTELIRRIMRWDMAVLRESPWYQEIFSEGLQQGLQQGLLQGLQQGLEQGREKVLKMLLGVLRHRFGEVSEELVVRLGRFSAEELSELLDLVFDVSAPAELYAFLPDGAHQD